MEKEGDREEGWEKKAEEERGMIKTVNTHTQMHTHSGGCDVKPEPS